MLQTNEERVAQQRADRQALLTISFLHVVQQGEPSMSAPDAHSNAGSCAYRGAEGRSCAAGPFITEYDTSMEGFNWSAMLDNMLRDERAGVKRGKVDEVAARERDFVRVLQSAHDAAAVDFTAAPNAPKRHVGAEFMVRYLKRIIDIAASYELQLPRIPLK